MVSIDRNVIVKSYNSTEYGFKFVQLIVQRLIKTIKTKVVPKWLKIYSPRDFCHRFLETFARFHDPVTI